MKKAVRLMVFSVLVSGLIPSIIGQDVKTVDDVQIIQNGKKPKPPKGVPSKVSFDLLNSIGQSDDPEKSFSQLSSFVVDDEGTMFALDFKELKIKVFEHEGRFIRWEL